MTDRCCVVLRFVIGLSPRRKWGPWWPWLFPYISHLRDPLAWGLGWKLELTINGHDWIFQGVGNGLKLDVVIAAQPVYLFKKKNWIVHLLCVGSMNVNLTSIKVNKKTGFTPFALGSLLLAYQFFPSRLFSASFLSGFCLLHKVIAL